MKIGVAFCGSFCTTQKIIKKCEQLVEKGYDVTPIYSEHVNNFDTRFGSKKDIHKMIEDTCKNSAITDIVTAEHIGPYEMFDVLVLAPCTGNTLAKLACGITDNTVTMATKSHLRNQKPVVIALATNDGLSASLQNIATLLNRKHYYFVPLGQDDPEKKPNSLVCNIDLIEDTIKNALEHKQIQPFLLK